jgi:hypothetical protein
MPSAKSPAPVSDESDGYKGIKQRAGPSPGPDISGLPPRRVNSRKRLALWNALITLRLEGATAAAGLHCIGIVERKASALQTVVEVDRRAIEVKGAFFVDHDRNTVVFVL